jgi:AAA domain, putative AbiEii toxin, Type IV TA system/AAA ATPase domain
MISRVWFEEFRALRKVDIALEPLTVFVGPNSAGKTSILEGVQALLEGVKTDPGPVFKDRWEIDRARQAPDERYTVLGAELQGTAPRDQVAVQFRKMTVYPQQPPAMVGSVYARCEGHEGRTKDQIASFGYVGNFGESFLNLQRSLPLARHLRLELKKLAAPDYQAVEIPVLGEDGAGLASVIADLALRVPDAHQAIVERLRAVIPSVRRVRVVGAQVDVTEPEPTLVDGKWINYLKPHSYRGYRVVLDMAGGDGIPLERAGEGTALVLGLLTFLHTHSTGVLLLDDIDKALHPKAQEDLIDTLRMVMSQRSDLQILATTHSPFVLNKLAYEEVRLATVAADGSTIVGSLIDHPQYARWKDHVQPGELWTSELEGWLAKRHMEPAA